MLIATAVVFIGAAIPLSLLAFAIDIATGAYTAESAASGQITLTPLMLLLGVNLPLILGALTVFVFHLTLLCSRRGTFWSVDNRFRWGWAGLALAVTVPLLGAYLVFFSKLGAEFTGVFGPTEFFFFAVILLTTPLQAAAEEIMFRGFLPRAVSRWIPNVTVGFWVGAVVSSLAFMSAHFAADIWLNAYYFLFGFAAFLLVRATGGLEAAIVVHAVNNVFAFIMTVLLGQTDQSFDRSAGVGGPFVLIQIAAILIMCAILFGLARWRKLNTKGIPQVKVSANITAAQNAYAPYAYASAGQAGYSDQHPQAGAQAPAGYAAQEPYGVQAPAGNPSVAPAGAPQGRGDSAPQSMPGIPQQSAGYTPQVPGASAATPAQPHENGPAAPIRQPDGPGVSGPPAHSLDGPDQNPAPGLSDDGRGRP